MERVEDSPAPHLAPFHSLSTMSAWSSATGKAQLSYADRLRQASKSSAPAKQDSQSSSSPSQRRPSQDTGKVSTSASTSLSVNNDSQNGTRLSSASSTSAPRGSSNASKALANSTGAKQGSTAAASESSTKSQNNPRPPVNVWQARRKQIAQREAEKERERQAALAQQTKPTGASGSVGSNANASSSPSKQTNASSSNGPKKGTQRNSKGPSDSASSGNKANKQTNQASQSSNRASSSASISSPATPTSTSAAGEKTQLTNATPRASNAASVNQKSSNKVDSHAAKDVSKAAHQSAQPSTSDKTTKSQNPKNEDKTKAADPTNTTTSSSNQTEQTVQDQAAQVPPSSVASTQSTQAVPATAPSVLYEDIPASPATVASAIEEVLKNGGPNGAQTEDDDAWLARIHLLNGGQNMPKFGGFGSNGVSSLSDEAETLAAKNAERAVAAAWGAGKSVWNKSQQQSQQQHRAASAAATPVQEAVTDKAAKAEVETTDAAQKSPGGTPEPTTTATASGKDAAAQSGEVGASAPQKNQNQKANASAHTPGRTNTEAIPPAKKSTEEKSRSHTADQSQKTTKGTASQQSKAAILSVPPFEDVNNWPSPLDAGKKSTEKPKTQPPASDADKSDATKTSTQPKQQKSFFETLDELQLRLAPNANPSQVGSAVGGRKAKQWVSILPDITHNSTSTTGGGGSKGVRANADGKGGKGGMRQQQQQQTRKEGGKGGGQQSMQGSTKKDVGKTSAGASVKVGQAKEGVVSNNAKKGAQQGDAQTTKGGVGAEGKPRASVMSTNSTRPATETKAQNQDSAPTRSNAAESSIAATEEFRSGSSTPMPASAGVTGKQQKAPRTQQLHTSAAPNGINGGNGGNFKPSPAATTKRTLSGSGTPTTPNRGSPLLQPLPRVTPSSDPAAASYSIPTPIFYPTTITGPSGAATPMLPTPTPSHSNTNSTWNGFNPYLHPPHPSSSAFLPDTTSQTGSPLPSGSLGQLLGQIEFYFSQQNLQGDFFLRSKMDSKGWVDIPLVARFKRVQAITSDLKIVKDALLWSQVLDVDVDKMRVRRRFGWELFTLPQPKRKVEEGEGEKEGSPALGLVATSGFGSALEG